MKYAVTIIIAVVLPCATALYISSQHDHCSGPGVQQQQPVPMTTHGSVALEGWRLPWRLPWGVSSTRRTKAQMAVSRMAARVPASRGVAQPG